MREYLKSLLYYSRATALHPESQAQEGTSLIFLSRVQTGDTRAQSWLSPLPMEGLGQDFESLWVSVYSSEGGWMKASLKLFQLLRVNELSPKLKCKTTDHFYEKNHFPFFSQFFFSITRDHLINLVS